MSNLPVRPDTTAHTSCIGDSDFSSSGSSSSSSSGSKYTPHNIWNKVIFHNHNKFPPSFSQSHIDSFRRSDSRHSVEVRDLPLGHPLCGEQGLFALRDFEPFDLIGSYTGVYVDADARGFPNGSLVKSGHYLAHLDTEPDTLGRNPDLGINAEQGGNEMRFINSYLNVADGPNCVMRTVYVDSLPRVIIVCTKKIAFGEEILLDYGTAYNLAYILPKPFKSVVMSGEELLDALPMSFADDDFDDNEGDRDNE